MADANVDSTPAEQAGAIDLDMVGDLAEQKAAEIDAEQGTKEPPYNLEPYEIDLPPDAENEAAAVEEEEPAEAKDDDTDEDDEPAEKPEPKKEEPRTYKVKVKGEEREVNEDDYHKLAQLGAGAMTHMRQRAELERQLREERQWRDTLKQGDANAVADMLAREGLDVRKIVEDILVDRIAEEQLTPEQRELRQRQRELEQREKQLQQHEERRRQDIHRANVEAAQREYESVFSKAMETAGFPKNQYTLARIAHHQLEHLEQGIELSPDELAQKVREEYASDFRASLESMNDEQLLEWIGDERMKRVRAKDLERVKAKPPQSQGNGKAAPKRKRREGPKLLDDVSREIDELYRLGL